MLRCSMLTNVPAQLWHHPPDISIPAGFTQAAGKIKQPQGSGVKKLPPRSDQALNWSQELRGGCYFLGMGKTLSPPPSQSVPGSAYLGPNAQCKWALPD